MQLAKAAEKSGDIYFHDVMSPEGYRRLVKLLAKLQLKYGREAWLNQAKRS